MNTPKHIHFIGICGVGMGALAIMMKKKGHKVTGSDVGFYPPISTHLQENNIEYYAGWHTEQVGTPDLVVVGNVAGSENPEWKLVQENKIPFVSYPELIARELVRKNSIVCAGTYGKTSTSALLAWILINAGENPAYMFGGLSQTPALASEDLGGDWSVLEGDEYKTARWDNSPKFSHYSPTHLLLTAVKWDHADVYPTESGYFEAFEKLAQSIPDTGLAIISENVPKNITDKFAFSKITYGQTTGLDYTYSAITQTKDGLHFEIQHHDQKFSIRTNLLGAYQAENICGAFALACEIGIAPEKIIESIASFAGIKRRLEKRGSTKNYTPVYDDIAHSPTKVKSVLENLRKIFIGKTICVFEPNTGNRTHESIPAYAHAFDLADEVIIPKLTKLKNDSEYLDGEQLAQIIKKDNPNTIYIEDDDQLVTTLNQATPSDVIVFCGSHGFRGMIDKMIRPDRDSSHSFGMTV